jgi:hypothetical protein
MQTTHKFSDFPQDEQEDFESACRASSIPLEEFEVTAAEQAAANPSPIARTVTVRRKGKVMEYNGGHGSKWIIQFELDLQKHVFD